MNTRNTLAGVFLTVSFAIGAASQAFPSNSGAQYYEEGGAVNQSLAVSTLSRQTRIPSQIFFAGDNVASLYINGVFKASTSDWREFREVAADLKHGDRIGIIARDWGGWYGAVVGIEMSGVGNLGTGLLGEPWRATVTYDAQDRTHWMREDFTGICQWPAAKLRPEPWKKDTPGKAPGFPYGTGGRYVWAINAVHNSKIYMRYRIGGEDCAAASTVDYAADNSVVLYVNGQSYGFHGDWERSRRVNLRLKPGDVIGMHVRDQGGWYGAVAVLRRHGMWSRTGVEEWKAVKQFRTGLGGVNFEWTKKTYRACHWPRAEVRPDPGMSEGGKARDFPYYTGAKYVWARGVGGNEFIFLRHVVGGERC